MFWQKIHNSRVVKNYRVTLTWSCNPPFALGRTVTAPLALGSNRVEYRGTAETPCLIVLRNLSQTEVQTVTITAVKRSG